MSHRQLCNQLKSSWVLDVVGAGTLATRISLSPLQPLVCHSKC